MVAQRTLLVDRPADGVVRATLNRPDQVNALRFVTFDELRKFCDSVDTDGSVRAVVLTGASPGFCAGLDLADARELPGMDAATMLRRQQGWADAILAFHRLQVPVIAAVNGAAAGAGLSLALAADIRLATPDTRFHAAFVRIGLTGGDCGSSWLLPRIVGLGPAAEILLTGRFVDAEEAQRIGMVSRIVAEDKLLDEALAVAGQISANSPFGVRLTKHVLHANANTTSLDAAIELENRNQVLATRSPDMSEALAAFNEKRQPRFEG